MKKIILLACLAFMAGNVWADELTGGPLIQTNSEINKEDHLLNASVVKEGDSDILKGSFWKIDQATDKVTLTRPLPKSIYKRHGHIYLADGRICKGCTVYKNSDLPEELGLIVDSRGKWYRSHGFPLVGIDEHPYARAYAMGAALAAQQYTYQQQQQNYINQMKPVRNWSCSGYGNSASCYGY
jgi:hypothetical protein